MPITAADLIAYCAQNRPTDDTSTAGGDIADPAVGTGTNKGIRPVFTQLAATDDIEVASSGTSDGTKNVTANGRVASGVTDTENINISATANSYTAGVKQWERILDLTVSADPVGTITVRRSPGGATVCTIPPGERGVSALFKRSVSEASQAVRYDLIYWKNAHGTFALQEAKVRLSADPDARIAVGVHTAVGNAGTITNRKTAPAGVTFVDDGVDQNVPGTNLANGARIGQWIRQTLPANDTPHKTTFTSQISGFSI